MIHFTPADSKLCTFMRNSFITFSLYSKLPKFLFTLLLLLLSFNNYSWGVSVGDYKSNATNFNWTTPSSWRVCTSVTPETWSTTSYYPGQNAGTGNVQIQDSHTVTLDGMIIPKAIGSLTVGTTSTGGNLNFSNNVPSTGKSFSDTSHTKRFLFIKYI